MTISQTIRPHLPYLRRFARAVTGTQRSGDACAVATLEAILASPEVLDASLDSKVALYKVFLGVCGSVLDKLDTPGTDVGDPRGARWPTHRLDFLATSPRIAFVLSAIEGFSADQIATAMGCDASEAAHLLQQASQDLASQLVTDVLIIEDEPFIAMDIESLVESLGHRVASVARTHKEAVAAVAKKRPGLILADIQLADGSSGINAVNEILLSYSMPVIFITAYPERLLTGEKPEPAFLISKPFRHEVVKAVISQALFFDQTSAAPKPKARSRM